MSDPDFYQVCDLLAPTVRLEAQRAGLCGGVIETPEGGISMVLTGIRGRSRILEILSPAEVKGPRKSWITRMRQRIESRVVEFQLSAMGARDGIEIIEHPSSGEKPYPNLCGYGIEGVITRLSPSIMPLPFKEAVSLSMEDCAVVSRCSRLTVARCDACGVRAGWAHNLNCLEWKFDGCRCAVAAEKGD